MPGTAIFDLDKTITRQGTWSRFIRYATGGSFGFWAKLPLNGWQALKYKAGFADRASVKVCSIALYFEGQEKAALQEKADAFVAKDIASGLRKEARAVIEAHRAAGDRLIIASAAVDLICNAMARELGFDGVICTRLSWGEDNRLRSALEGENCYGVEKLRRVEAFFDGKRPPGPVVFYSDHHTDLPCLKWADRGVAVNPSPQLRKRAPANNVEIVDWDA
jgi:HAD superfamily hydrolase (TIGR01490 family)